MWSPPPLLTLPDWVLLGGDMVTRWSCRPAHDTGQPRPRHPHTTSALCQCQATPIITRGPELPWTQLTSTPPPQSTLELETKAIRMFAKVSIVSYSRPSLMIIALATQFPVYLPWGQRLFSIVS